MIANALTLNQLSVFFNQQKLSNDKFKLDYMIEINANKAELFIFGKDAFEKMKVGSPHDVDMDVLEKEYPTKYTREDYWEKLHNAATPPADKKHIAEYLARPRRTVNHQMKLVDCNLIGKCCIQMKFSVKLQEHFNSTESGHDLYKKFPDIIPLEYVTNSSKVVRERLITVTF